MNARVLLVDDSSTARLMAETVFKQHTPYDVITANDGLEGVRKAIEHKPDLILLDVVMPNMDGFAACAEMRKHDALKHIPIVMVTSRGEPTDTTPKVSAIPDGESSHG